MEDITGKALIDQLPGVELEETLAKFLQPVTNGLPDVRMRKTMRQMVRGIIGSESPVVTQMAQTVARTESGVWASAKRMYGLLWNERLSWEAWHHGLEDIAWQIVERERPDYLVVVLDPVNFEKPYTEALEGVSVVYKSTPPALGGGKRLVAGYPSLTATVVNTSVPATFYAHWFSYEVAEFVSQNVEIEKAIESTERLFGAARLRYVLDAGFDDQRWLERLAEDEFVIRACHLERKVEVYNDRLRRWESETLADLVDSVPFSHTCRVSFTHARQQRLATIRLGWFPFFLPDKKRPLWAIVAYDTDLDRTLVLLTNVPLHSIQDVLSVYNDWRLRPRIEHGYRFDQEQGLDVEDMRVQTLERMRRLFILVLLAAQFIFFLIHSWPPPAVLWIRQLGGKLGLQNDLDGPYLVLRGLAALIQAFVTYSHAFVSPFPKHAFSFG